MRVVAQTGGICELIETMIRIWHVNWILDILLVVIARIQLSLVISLCNLPTTSEIDGLESCARAKAQLYSFHRADPIASDEPSPQENSYSILNRT